MHPAPCLKLKHSAILLANAIALTGCATGAVKSTDLEPVYRVEAGGGQPDSRARADYYTRGKAQFEAGRYGLALQAFTAAWRQNRRSIVALNGIAASYDQLGRYDAAMTYYYKALSVGPESGRTWNNLGYSLMLQNRFAEARSILRVAARQHPDNDYIRAHLALAERRTDAISVAARLGPPRAVDVPIEVANGNGRNGMARLVGRVLGGRGLAVERITNADNFNHADTVIYYAAGQRAQAQRLADHLPVAAVVKPARGGLGVVEVKVVLGRDMLVHESDLQTMLSDYA
jgi:tetratricopeptide (TPR) repeat protein